MQSNTTITVDEALKQNWLNYQKQNPKARIRNAAVDLGVSEMDLLQTRLGDGVTRLQPNFAQQIIDVERLGAVMALSRNHQVVHEKHGVYTKFKTMGGGNMGLCLGEIDLRVFFKHWHHGFAVAEATETGTRHSLQYFNEAGLAVHKVYATDKTDMQAWVGFVSQNSHSEQLVQNTTSSDTRCVSGFVADPAKPKAVASEVQQHWDQQKDVHDFHGMLQKLNVSRLEAFAAVNDNNAHPIPVAAAEQALSLAAEREVPIMLFVGNLGIVQIHTGVVKNLRRTGPWYNVLDPEFNLHLNTEELKQAWVVRRPSDDGTITSLEFYNANEELVLTLFGERKPGVPELAAWQELVTRLEQDLVTRLEQGL